MCEPKVYRKVWSFGSCAVIVAHPDDETLWTGGTILMHPESRWTVITLCRGSDQDRSPKFFRALEKLKANGAMGDIDDGPEQAQLADLEVQNTMLSLLPSDRFDLIITHSHWGEYTRHLRHEETGRAVLTLCKAGKLSAGQIWTFAYEDGGGQHWPQPVQDADIHIKLPEAIWHEKYNIITKIYGFASDSFEAKATVRKEAFWLFKESKKIQKHFNNGV